MATRRLVKAKGKHGESIGINGGNRLAKKPCNQTDRVLTFVSAYCIEKQYGLTATPQFITTLTGKGSQA